MKSVSSMIGKWFALPLMLLVCASLFGQARAGKYNELLSIGDQAPAFEKLPGVDDQDHSLKDFEKYDVLVVVFTCNSCPYAVDYQSRINELAKKYDGQDSRVAVVAINVNKIKEDLMPAMKERAAKEGFVFPYLFDETQEIAKDYGAGRTPEFYVLDKSRKIVYMGAFDDNTKEADVKKHYVEDAIAATLGNEVVAVAETPSVGCAIRYARDRKR